MVSVQPISTSKTVWASALTMLIGVLTWAGVVTGDKWTPEHIEAVTGTIITVVGLINMVLRVWFTTGPILTQKTLPAMPDKEVKS